MKSATALCALLASGPASAAPQFLVTAPPLEDLVQGVSCGEVGTTALIPRGADPHSFVLTPALRARLEKAEVLVRVGGGYESWLKAGAWNPRAATLEVVLPGSRDPHFWNSPASTRAAAQRLAAFFKEKALLPAGKVESCLARFQKDTESAEARVRALLAPIPEGQRAIATAHDSLSAFGEAFGIRTEPLLGLNAEGSPSPSRLRELVSALRSQKVRAIFVESTTPPRLAEAVARDAGVHVGGELVVDSLAPKGSPGDTIVGTWIHNGEVIAAALKK